MATMDVFKSDAFSCTSLTGVVNTMDYKPQLLGSLGIYTPKPVRTRTVFVDRKDNQLTLVPNSPIGSAPQQLEGDSRTAVPLQTTRLAKGFTLTAEEISGVRAFGSESELEQVQQEYLSRLQRSRNDIELTHENHRLGALQGMLLDSDGATVIYNYFTEFGFTAPAAIDFALNVSTTVVRTKCAEVVRGMARSARGSFTTGTTVHALVGDEFYDSLIDHPNVVAAYQNYQAAEALREGMAFQAFTYGGITWHNYRGTDDNSTVAIGASDAKFFPVGASDVFTKAMAPAEFMPYVNTLGKDTYALNIPDRDRQAWNKGEIYSYPLYICQRPDVLRSAVSGN